MDAVTVKRGVTLTVVAGGFVLLVASVVWACVPQVGTLEAVVTSAADPANQGTEVNTAVEDVVVGDGDPNTNHHDSWCGEFGGHPIDALYAANGDTIEVTVGPATRGQINEDDPNTPDKDEACPVSNSQLEQDTNYIWVENGITTGDEDVYEWVTDAEGGEPFDYSPHGGFWAFLDGATDNDGVGDGVGCYKSGAGADPKLQGTLQVAADGTGSTSFELKDMVNTNNDANDDKDGQPGDHTSLLCVGDDIDDPDPQAIFAPLSVTSI